jgi:hypothetical protein
VPPNAFENFAQFAFITNGNAPMPDNIALFELTSLGLKNLHNADWLGIV